MDGLFFRKVIISYYHYHYLLFYYHFRLDLLHWFIRRKNFYQKIILQ